MEKKYTNLNDNDTNNVFPNHSSSLKMNQNLLRLSPWENGPIEKVQKYKCLRFDPTDLP